MAWKWPSVKEYLNAAIVASVVIFGLPLVQPWFAGILGVGLLSQVLLGGGLAYVGSAVGGMLK